MAGGGGGGFVSRAGNFARQRTPRRPALNISCIFRISTLAFNYYHDASLEIVIGHPRYLAVTRKSLPRGAPSLERISRSARPDGSLERRIYVVRNARRGRDAERRRKFALPKRRRVTMTTIHLASAAFRR